MRNHRVSLMALLLLVLPLLGFTPFTEVQDVCPSCPRPTNDAVIMKSGQSIWCDVIGENDDFYVLERHGELRAALKSEVESVKWGQGRGTESMRSGDAILLKNNVLYFGSILSEDPGVQFTIQTQIHKQIPAVNMVQSVHKGQRLYTFRPAAPPPPKPAAAPAPTKTDKPKPKAKPAKAVPAKKGDQ